MDPKAASGKQHNQHPYLVLNRLIKRYTYHFWVTLRFLNIYLICSSNGITYTLTPQIYKVECCVLHLQQIRIRKQSQSQEKNCRLVVSTLVKLSDESKPILHIMPTRLILGIAQFLNSVKWGKQKYFLKVP